MQDIEVVKVVKIWSLINSYLMGQVGITAKSYLSWVCVCPGTINIYNILTLIEKKTWIVFSIYTISRNLPQNHIKFCLCFWKKDPHLRNCTLFATFDFGCWPRTSVIIYSVFLCNVSVFQISICFVIVSLSAHIPAWTDKCKLQLDRFSSLNFSRNFRSFLNGNYMYWCQT